MTSEASNLSGSSQRFASATISRTISSAEIRQLRRVPDQLPKRLWVVAFIAFWERFAFWGLTAPWQNYMQNPPGVLVPGGLNLGQVLATRIYCAFYIVYYFTPISFAIISDTRLGRYMTLNICAVLYTLGCIILTVTSQPSLVDRGSGLAGFLVAMFLIAVGGGGFHTIIVPFIADQYTETRPKLKTLRTGKRVVTDRAMTLTYIYNVYYWVGNVGSLSWFATTFLEQRYDFQKAYLLTVLSMIIATLMLLVGGKSYVKVPHERNILPKATKILLCASRNGFKMAHTVPDYLLEHRGKTVSWSSSLVDELTSGLKACRVLIAFVAFYICFDQMQNNLISQAAEMENHDLPNDLMPGLNQIFCIILGPLIQHGLYPYLHRRKVRFGPIARITVGFGFVALSMMYAALVQQLIYSSGPCYKYPRDCVAAIPPAPSLTPALSQAPNRVDMWIQTPVYAFLAIGEIFALVTGFEYAYDNSPQHMKAIVQAISQLVAGMGSVCALGLTPIARDPYLVTLYACLTTIITVTTIAFCWFFRRYDDHASNEHEIIDWEIEETERRDFSRRKRETPCSFRLRPVAKVSEGSNVEKTVEIRLDVATATGIQSIPGPQLTRSSMATETDPSRITIPNGWDTTTHPNIRNTDPAHNITGVIPDIDSPVRPDSWLGDSRAPSEPVWGTPRSNTPPKRLPLSPKSMPSPYASRPRASTTVGCLETLSRSSHPALPVQSPVAPRHARSQTIDLAMLAYPLPQPPAAYLCSAKSSTEVGPATFEPALDSLSMVREPSELCEHPSNADDLHSGCEVDRIPKASSMEQRISYWERKSHRRSATVI